MIIFKERTSIKTRLGGKLETKTIKQQYYNISSIGKNVRINMKCPRSNNGNMNSWETKRKQKTDAKRSFDSNVQVNKLIERVMYTYMMNNCTMALQQNYIVIVNVDSLQLYNIVYWLSYNWLHSFDCSHNIIQLVILVTV